MTIKRLLQLFICIIIPLLVIVVITAVFLNKKENEVEASQQKRFKSYMLAEDLLSSSELLTRFARTYVVTKDVRYKTYFQDVLDIRNGKL
jgi:flagellar basal body-associated protein FliL